MLTISKISLVIVMHWVGESVQGEITTALMDNGGNVNPDRQFLRYGTRIGVMLCDVMKLF